ncbi:DUF3127 domain-containing protein [Alistipes sp. OttesenSCG-928-B03]|nr:DUF3127 domain-containing protein [Alistipes sp. OttesenSCG-928-B03]
MEFEGLVLQILQQVRGTGARGEWVKQEVIFEQAGEFGRKICVSFWGDRAADAAALKPGQKVRVSANIESREFNGRWYTEARAWKMDAAAPAVQAAPPAADFPPADAFGEEPAGSSASGSYKDGFDDLPF